MLLRFFLLFAAVFSFATIATAETIEHLPSIPDSYESLYKSEGYQKELVELTQKDDKGKFSAGEERISLIKKRTCKVLKIKDCKVDLQPYLKDGNGAFTLLVVKNSSTGKEEALHLPSGKRFALAKGCQLTAIDDLVSTTTSQEKLLTIFKCNNKDGGPPGERAVIVEEKETVVMKYLRLRGGQGDFLLELPKGEKGYHYFKNTLTHGKTNEKFIVNDRSAAPGPATPTTTQPTGISK